MRTQLKNDILNVTIFIIVYLITVIISLTTINHNLYFGMIVSVLINARYQIYLSEVLHEATHFNFFRTRKINDLIANIILFPFLLTTVQKT